ncbi:trypsin-like serine protease [Micromonospora sp. STR1_7]|uniref:Trypsin-like serine protease n=1 Tax=Micromonospora parastrephiae TaxID=2806101 RepID=A0ABS1XTR8_9ACTN|nr:S1 family peptidase [Micromonospora parastrephiae]MBM0232554.1 trypsin-like serine protease [Micromonospora parastrephiae]
MRRSPLVALVLTTLLLVAPGAAQAAVPDRAAADPAAVLAGVRTAGTAWGLDPTIGRMTLTVDDTVAPAELTALRAVADRAGALLRREPGTLRTLIAGGEGIYGGGGRCSLGANVRSGSTYYVITAGHCTAAASTWYADSAQTTVLGTRTATSFPSNDYGLIRHTGRIAHPSAVYTYPGLLPIYGAGNAYVGQAVCRSGATTGVRCGTVTALNQTVNFAGGNVVSGLIRTNICAEPGDSGGPLYVPSTGTIIGILSGGSGNCTSGGTSYYQPIGEVLAAYGLTLP